jgi:hypothetical protein
MSLSNKLFNSKIPFQQIKYSKAMFHFLHKKLFFEDFFWENFNMFKNNITFFKLAIQLGYATSEWTHSNYSL